MPKMIFTAAEVRLPTGDLDEVLREAHELMLRPLAPLPALDLRPWSRLPKRTARGGVKRGRDGKDSTR